MEACYKFSFSSLKIVKSSYLVFVKKRKIKFVVNLRRKWKIREGAENGK